MTDTTNEFVNLVQTHRQRKETLKLEINALVDKIGTEKVQYLLSLLP